MIGNFSSSKRSSLLLAYLLLCTCCTLRLDASVVDVYNDFCALFGNTSSLESYDIDQITSKILNQVNCSKNPTLDCMDCLSSQKLLDANIIGSSISPDDLGRVSLLVYCYLNDLNQFCQVDSTPDYSACLGYLTNNTNSMNTGMLTSSLGNRIAPIYQVSNEYHPIQGINWDANCIDGKYLVKKYQNQDNLVQGANRLNGLFSDIIYMMYNNMRLGCDMPYSNWFTNQMFTKNGLLVDSLTIQDLASIMTKMGIPTTGSSLVVKNYALQNLLFSQNMSLVSNEQIVKADNTNISPNSVYTMTYDRCYSPSELAQIFSQTPNSMSQSDFTKLAPSLVYMSSSSICQKQSATTTATRTNQPSPVSSTQVPTPAEKYGYGTIAIVIVSLLALLGIILIPCFGKSTYPKILMVLTALAVGTLLSDAMLHLIPDILSVEAGETTYMYIPQYAIYVSAAIGAIWIFWIIETVIHHFAHIERVVAHSHGHGGLDDDDDHDDHCHTHDEKIKTVAGVMDGGVVVATDSGHQLTEVKGAKRPKFVQTLKFGKLEVKKIRATGWILLLGDAIHNFADGMAIGASFAVSARMGIATTIAVVCHEVPHELGNYAVLVKSGFNHCQALIFNLCSALTCLIGFYIGASVSTDPLVSTWIFTITAGMFLYLALVDLLPQVMHAIKWSWSIFIACNLAMLFGYGVMLMLVVIEGHIIL